MSNLDCLYGISPPAHELQCLLRCARSRHSEGDLAQLRGLVAGGLDWDRLLAAGARHGVTPLLYFSLKALKGADVPADVLARLHDDVRRTAQINAQIVQALLALLAAFQRAGIPVAFFKGPVLTLQAYGNLSRRQFCDLDVLIHKQDFPAARALLEGLEYEALTDHLLADEATHIRRNHDYPFLGKGHPHITELQWGVMQEPIPFPRDLDALWRRMGSFTIAGRPVPTLADADLVLVLAMHGAKHLWYRLKWICDIAELTQARPDLDWDEIVARARATGCLRALLLAMSLANSLLGMPLPAVVFRELAKDRMVPLLRADVYRWLFADEALDTERPIFFYRLMERLRERMLISATYAPTLVRPVRFFRTYGLRSVRYIIGG